jgi:hypothetical protein
MKQYILNFQKKFGSLLVFSTVALSVRAQYVAINNDGSLPSASAMLDIKSSREITIRISILKSLCVNHPTIRL